jgi:hypothetical protein
MHRILFPNAPQKKFNDKTFVVACELFHDSRPEVRDFWEGRSMFLREIRETAGSSIRNEAIEVWNLAAPFMAV